MREEHYLFALDIMTDRLKSNRAIVLMGTEEEVKDLLVLLRQEIRDGKYS